MLIIIVFASPVGTLHNKNAFHVAQRNVPTLPYSPAKKNVEKFLRNGISSCAFRNFLVEREKT